MSLKRLTESFKDWGDNDNIVEAIPLALTEANKKVTVNENSYDVLGGYKIPIWRLGEKNRNGRIYEEALADKVIKENKVTTVLDGHPSDDYTPKLEDIIAVAKNPTKEKVGKSKIMYAEVYFVKKGLHETVKRALDLGLNLEQSSSGLGELKEDDITVNTSSYQLERYCDLLISESSYQVSFNKENEIAIKESVEDTEGIKNNNVNEKLTINNIETINEKKEVTMKNTATIPVSLIRKNIESYIEQADKIEDLNSKLKTYGEIKEWIVDTGSDELKDLEEKVNGVLDTVIEKKEELAVKGLKTDSLEDELEKTKEELDQIKSDFQELTEKLEVCFDQLDSLKDYGNSYKEMFDITNGKINTMVEASEFIKLNKDVETLNEEKSKFKETIGKYKQANSKLKEQFESYITKVEKEKLEERRKLESIKNKRLEESVATKLEIERVELEEAKRLEEIERQKEIELNYYTERAEVKEYYNDLCKTHTSKVMNNFKESIINSKTLRDAQNRYFKYRSQIESLEEDYANEDKFLYEKLHTNKSVYKKQDNFSGWL